MGGPLTRAYGRGFLGSTTIVRGRQANRRPQLTSGPYPIDDEVSERFGRLVMRCLRFMPSERPTAHEVTSELMSMLEGVTHRPAPSLLAPRIH